MVTEESIKKEIQQFNDAKAELAKVIIGQKKIVDEIFIALLANGHILLEGVPGLGKTLLVRSLAKIMNLDFKRIQFTPDLMPSDIIGMEILEEDRSTGKRFFKFNKGPVFSNILLADEINRTPPKTQSALLEAMQEREVTYAGNSYSLPVPFFLLATQNPLEQSGTYPLPEAQLDRFLLYSVVEYPKADEEIAILSLTTAESVAEVEKVISEEIILSARNHVRQVFIDDELIGKVSKLVRNTRPQLTEIEEVKKYVEWGAGPRAGQAIIMAAKAKAYLSERFSVIPEDIEKVLMPVLRHRIMLNFSARAENIEVEDIVKVLK